MARWSDMSDKETWGQSSLATLAEKIGLHPSIVDFSKAVETHQFFYRIPAIGMADIEIESCIFAISDMSDFLF